MTNTEVHEAFIVWLNGIYGITVIKDRQGINRPQVPYIMVDLANYDQLNHWPSGFKYEIQGTQNSEGLDELKATPVTEVMWTFLVFYYGQGGGERLKLLKTATQLSQVQEPLVPGLSIHDVGTINLVPEFVDERWEPRAQVNVTMHGVSDDGFVIDVVEEHTPYDIAIE